MPSRTSRITCPGSEPSSGSTSPGTSHATLSAPTASGLCSAHQRDPLASIPPAARNASGSSHSAPVPVRTRITSPATISSPSAARSRSSAPTAWPASAQSSSTPRANSGGIVSVAQLGEALGRLHLRVDLDAAVHAEVLRLVAERVDVRAGVLGHDEQRGGARARLPQPRLVAAVQLQQHAGLVRRPHRRTGVARLLEVVELRARERVRQFRHSTGTSSLPCVSGRNRSATIAST